VRNKVLAPAITLANEILRQADETPLPHAITPHSLRRTYISLLLEAGDPRVVMQQAGHANPDITLRVYAQVMQRREQTGGRPDQLVALNGQKWAEIEGSRPNSSQRRDLADAELVSVQSVGRTPVLAREVMERGAG